MCTFNKKPVQHKFLCCIITYITVQTLTAYMIFALPNFHFVCGVWVCVQLGTHICVCCVMFYKPALLNNTQYSGSF